jgi:DNA mismatch repair protein MutL
MQIYVKEPKTHFAKHYTADNYAGVFGRAEMPQTSVKDSKPEITEAAENPPLHNALKNQDMALQYDDIKVLGQFFDAYITAQKDDMLYIFDQHAAAERIRYETYLSQAGARELKLQQMLMPENFELSLSLAEILKSNLSVLKELGLEVEEFGDKSFRVTAYPALLGDISTEHIVKKIIEDLEIEKNCEIEKKREKIIRSACRASIKAGDAVSSLEAKKLITDLFKCNHPFTCPHGRPTAYKISKNELEKFFKRK